MSTPRDTPTKRRAAQDRATPPKRLETDRDRQITTAETEDAPTASTSGTKDSSAQTRQALQLKDLKLKNGSNPQVTNILAGANQAEALHILNSLSP